MVSDFDLVKRHRVVTHAEYWCELDEYQRPDGAQMLLCHIRFTKFTPSILRRLLHEWKLFRSVVTAPLFAYAGEDDTDKWVRFVKLLGFEPLGTEILCQNGDCRKLFISR